jgi:hypothetical protein
MLLAGILVLASVVFGIGIYACAPSISVAIALPASFLVLHIGGSGGGNNLSVSDAILFIATLCALPLMHLRGAVNLKRWMVLVAIYQATTLLSVVNSPNRFDAVEWFHQILMVVGAALVGWVMVERSRVRIGFRGYLLISSVLSVWAMVLWIAHSLHPIAGLPYGLQKNTLGDLIVIAILAVHLAPTWIGFTDRWMGVLRYVCIAGVIATGSRQAMIGLVVAVFVVTLRDRRLLDRGAKSRKSVLMLLALALIAAVVYTGLSDEIASHSHLNSLAVRSASYAQTLKIWHTSPLFGVGERYWYNGHFPGSFQPPNAEIGMLATGGMVGLAGFLVLVVGTLWMLWRLPSALGSLALAVMVAHVVEGQFDIFWVTATGSVPWIIMGMTFALARQSDARKIVHRPSAAVTGHKSL